MHEIIIAPIEPEIVLFGLIFLHNFGPLKNFPNIKPPISDPIQASKIENKINFNWTKFEKKKNKKQKKNIKIVNEKLTSNKEILFFKILQIKLKNSMSDKIPKTNKHDIRKNWYFTIKIRIIVSPMEVITLFLRFFEII